MKDGEAKRAYEREWYRNNPQRRAAVRARIKRIRADNQAFIREYLESHPCVDCGYSDWRALEFDHVRGEKRNNVSTLVRDGNAIQSVIDEIVKCEVRCANCHRIKTFANTYRGSLA